MKSGRPAYHIRAKWITVSLDPRAPPIFYELDKKGNLCKNNSQLIPKPFPIPSRPIHPNAIPQIQIPNALTNQTPVPPQSVQPPQLQPIPVPTPTETSITIFGQPKNQVPTLEPLPQDDSALIINDDYSIFEETENYYFDL